MNLKRRRWGVRAVLALGIAASITGNVLHAQDNPISQAISAWPPLAFLITVELISRIPVHSRRLAAVRMGATAVIAGIAAWVSYWHMAAVAARYGETGSSPYLIPVSVDGLVVVASICLVELAGRISAGEEEVSGGQELLSTAGGSAAGLGAAREGRDGAPAVGDPGEGVREVGAPAQGAGEPVAAPAQIKPPRKPHTSNPQRIARAHRQHPEETPEQLAKRLNLSPATVKKYRPAAVSEGAPPEPVNGHVPEFVTTTASEEEK